MVRLGEHLHARPTGSPDLPRRSWVSGAPRAYARRSLSGSDYSTMHSSSPSIRRVSKLVAAAVLCGVAIVPSGSLAAAPGQQVPAQVPSPVHRVSSTVDEASEPSISSDGRWVVFSGRVGDRQTVFRTDRQTDTTVELSPIPAGARSGN